MLSRLRKISEFLSADTKFTDAIDFLGLNACHSGANSRLYFGNINMSRDSDYTPSWNLNLSPGFQRIYEQLITTLFLEKAVKSKSVIFNKHDAPYESYFLDSFGNSDDPRWKSTIVMPLPPHYYAAFSLNIDHVDNDSVEDYYNSLHAILKLFVLARVTKRKINTRKRESKEHSLTRKPLTERQELILKMIQEDKTNKTIAALMGYSESLIRQETVVIYRNLGVGGRKGISILHEE